MMTGQNFMVLADELLKVKPKDQESFMALFMYTECCNAVARACRRTSPKSLRYGQFLKRCGLYDSSGTTKGAHRHETKERDPGNTGHRY